MYRIFLRCSCSSRIILPILKKGYLEKVNTKHIPVIDILTHVMPPKRKAAAAKIETEDLVAGEDQSEPSIAPKLRRGRPKKEPEIENLVSQEIVTKRKTKKSQKEQEEPDTTEKPKKPTKKTVIPKEISDQEPKARGRQKVNKEEISDEEPKSKGRKKVNKDEKEEKVGRSNSTVTQWNKINFSCTKKNSKGEKSNLKISCWNVGGIKSWVKKGCQEYLKYEDPDIFCLQETKCSEEKLPEEIKDLNGYHQYWCASKREGYAGVGLLTKIEPLNVSYGINTPDQDEDGRCITAEFDDYYIVCAYVPNAGRKLVTLPKRLEWNTAFKDYIKSLDDKKPVIICGDMNVAHNEIDLARPANNTKNAGFTKEEREGMTDFLEDGYIDTFRKLYPDKTDVYTFWTYMANARSKNIGWRLDYFVISERLMDNVCDNIVRTEVLGSDHCPLTLFINI